MKTFILTLKSYKVILSTREFQQHSFIQNIQVQEKARIKNRTKNDTFKQEVSHCKESITI